MNIEELRAEFEAWRRKHYDYADLCAFEIEFAFDAFQAGRAALQSQDREDAERYRYLRGSAQLYSHFGDIDNSGWCVMRRDHTLRRVFTYNGPELDEAIDHDRRVEGET